MSPKLMMIGLDAADGDLILEWTYAGLLPNLSRLRNRGLVGRTHNPAGLYVGAIWPSFFTGVSPTRHGRYCFEQLKPGSYDRPRTTTRDIQAPPFWEHLSEAGKRVAIVDVPKSPLSRGLDGVQICDWGTHDPEPRAVFQAEPSSLVSQLLSRFGEEPVGRCNKIGRSHEELLAFRDGLLHRIETKTKICQELLSQEHWDLFLNVFTESHCAGHQLWSVHDSTHPNHDPKLAREMGDPLFQVYQAMDRGIGTLLQAAGPNTTVIVLASHGMGPHYDGSSLLDQILLRWEGFEPGPMRRSAVQWLNRCWEHASPNLSKRFRQRVKSWERELALSRGKRKLAFKNALLRPPLWHRKLFAVPNNDAHGAIRINLRGREPRGRVRPGREEQALYARLKRDLLDLRNIETGEPVVRDMAWTQDLYPREDVSALPDFIIDWERSAPIRGVYSDKLGGIRGEYSGVRSGDHTNAGLFFACGPKVEPGVLPDPVSVMDFAATAGDLLGVGFPGLDGKAISKLSSR